MPARARRPPGRRGRRALRARPRRHSRSARRAGRRKARPPSPGAYSRASPPARDRQHGRGEGESAHTLPFAARRPAVRARKGEFGRLSRAERVAPGEQPPQVGEVEVGLLGDRDEVPRAGLVVAIEQAGRDVLARDEHGALDLGGVAAEGGAVIVEHAALVRDHLGRAEGVPGVGPLRDQPQHDLLAAASDQHRDLAAHGRRVEQAEALVDHRQGVAERLQARDRRAELVAVLVCSRARTSLSRGRGSAGRRRCGRRCAPCRRAGSGCGRSCR